MHVKNGSDVHIVNSPSKIITAVVSQNRADSPYRSTAFLPCQVICSSGSVNNSINPSGMHDTNWYGPQMLHGPKMV